MTSKAKSDDAFLRSTNKSIDKTEKTKKENNKVKNFFKSTKFTIAATIILTLLAVYGTYSLYNFIYTKGYQDAKHDQAAIAKQVAELSKAN